MFTQGHTSILLPTRFWISRLLGGLPVEQEIHSISQDSYIAVRYYAARRGQQQGPFLAWQCQGNVCLTPTPRRLEDKPMSYQAGLPVREGRILLFFSLFFGSEGLRLKFIRLNLFHSGYHPRPLPLVKSGTLPSPDVNTQKHHRDLRNKVPC